MHTHTFLVKPSVGDFFVFPADLIHMVYPFESDGERRSFSMNMTVRQSELDSEGNPIKTVKDEDTWISGENKTSKFKVDNTM